MGAPVVAIFGPTDPSVWGPRGAQVEIFRDAWDPEEIMASHSTPSGLQSVSQLISLTEARLDTGITVR
jgi:hypothetical protein